MLKDSPLKYKTIEDINISEPYILKMYVLSANSRNYFIVSVNVCVSTCVCMCVSKCVCECVFAYMTQCMS